MGKSGLEFFRDHKFKVTEIHHTEHSTFYTYDMLPDHERQRREYEFKISNDKTGRLTFCEFIFSPILAGIGKLTLNDFLARMELRKKVIERVKTIKQEHRDMFMVNQLLSWQNWFFVGSFIFFYWLLKRGV